MSEHLGSWKARYIANLERILGKESFAPVEMLALVELESRIHATLEDHVERYKSYKRYEDPEPLGNVILDSQQLHDLYLVAYVDGELSKREAGIIESFLEKSLVLPEHAERIHQNARAEAATIVQSVLQRMSPPTEPNS